MKKIFELFHFYRLPFYYVTELLKYYSKKALGKNMVGSYGEWVHVLYMCAIKGNGKIKRLNNDFLKIYFKDGTNLLIRSFPSSDVKVLLQVWGEKEYGRVITILQATKTTTCKINIVDAGANVGYTTVFFKKYYPNANIFAIEPASINLPMIENNIKNNNLSSVIVEKSALWHKRTKLEIEQSLKPGNEWAFSVKEMNDGGIDSIGIDEILTRTGWEEIDLFKMDIEGAEQYLFIKDSLNSWLDKVKLLAIEIHPIGNLKEVICAILLSKGFQYFDYGELTIAHRQIPKR